MNVTNNQSQQYDAQYGELLLDMDSGEKSTNNEAFDEGRAKRYLLNNNNKQ